MKVDTIIVGQGIAGTCLSHTLIAAGQNVLVVDDGYQSNCSTIAAGLFNPVVFRKFTQTWKADLLIPFLHQFYQQLEAELQTRLLHPTPIHKVFTSDHQANEWVTRRDRGHMKDFMSLPADSGLEPEQWDMPFGGADVLQSGWVDTKALLNGFRKNLEEKGRFRKERLDTDQVEVMEEGVIWRGEGEAVEAERIIFCEGHMVLSNPHFDWLPMALTKGQLLTLRIPNLRLDKVVNRGFFIFSLGEDLYRVGATYEWDNFDQVETPKAREELLTKLRKVLQLPFEVVDQKAGVRPTVRDRKPLIGFHPRQRALMVFNGMGSRGIMLAPYFSRQMLALIECNEPIDPEAALTRFYELHS